MDSISNPKLPNSLQFELLTVFTGFTIWSQTESPEPKLLLVWKQAVIAKTRSMPTSIISEHSIWFNKNSILIYTKTSNFNTYKHLCTKRTIFISPLHFFNTKRWPKLITLFIPKLNLSIISQRSNHVHSLEDIYPFFWTTKRTIMRVLHVHKTYTIWSSFISKTIYKAHKNYYKCIGFWSVIFCRYHMKLKK